jgi:pilus assembly protein CpaC
VITPTRGFIVAAAALAAAGAISAAPAYAETSPIISIQSGQSIVVPAAGLTRVAVGDGRIAGVVPIGTTQIVINGKSPGHTTILVWAGGERMTYEVTVTEQSMDELLGLLRTMINEPDVQVLNVNKNIVIRGTVPDGDHFQHVTAAIGRFNGAKVNGADKIPIINAVEVAHPLGSLERELAGLPGGGSVRLERDETGNIVVSGHVPTRVDAERILQAARGLSVGILATQGKVIDRIITDTTSQVNIKVYVLEIDHTGQSTIGMRYQTAVPDSVVNPTSWTTFAGLTVPFVENGAAGATGKALNLGAFYRTTRIIPTIDLLLQSGHARILSAPNLTTMPGTEATFLVGGEIPYIYSSGTGTSSIVFKEYGVKLDVTPQIMGNGSVETKIAPEVSDLDFADGIEEGGFTIPALKTSKLSTDVITESGESIIMGGMLRHIENKTVTKVPGLSSIPILGKLFQSTAYQKNDTDVVFVLTPEIITR